MVGLLRQFSVKNQIIGVKNNLLFLFFYFLNKFRDCPSIKRSVKNKNPEFIGKARKKRIILNCHFGFYAMRIQFLRLIMCPEKCAVPHSGGDN